MHAHGHEEHDHEHEGHVHSADEHVHDHEAEGEGNPDEIVLTPEKAAAVGVVAETVNPGTFQEVLKVSGRIMPAPENETSVVANVAGVVSFARPLTEGSRVTEGSTVFTISSSNLMDGDPVQRARITYETAKKEYERAASLVGDKIVSQQEYEAARSRYETARLAYEAIAADGGNSGTAVKAPASGYIETCLVKEGDYVSVGTPLAGIVTGKQLFLKADVSERHFNRLSRVTSANFKLSYSDKVYSTSELCGRLAAYGRAADETSSYIPVTFTLNSREDILPGAFATVWLLSDPRDGVLSLPVGAITEEQGHYFVYIQLDPSCYRKQEVTLGAGDGRRFEILTGLNGGEKVVTKGAIHVKLASASNAIPAHTHNH